MPRLSEEAEGEAIEAHFPPLTPHDVETSSVMHREVAVWLEISDLLRAFRSGDPVCIACEEHLPEWTNDPASKYHICPSCGRANTK